MTTFSDTMLLLGIQAAIRATPYRMIGGSANIGWDYSGDIAALELGTNAPVSRPFLPQIPERER